jgi:uncharacterized damage-inducible protein DinB
MLKVDIYPNQKIQNMKRFKILLSLGVFALLVSQGSFAQTSMEEFITKWENGKKFTIAVVEKMPDNLMDYKPHPSAMSFKEQITHFSGTIAGISKGFLLGGDPTFNPEAVSGNKEELIQYVSNCYDYGKATFTNLTEAQLAEEIESFAGKVTRRQMIGLIDDHNTHHRGAAISYIRANGIEPPRFSGL